MPHFGTRCHHPAQVANFLKDRFERQPYTVFQSALDKYNEMVRNMSIHNISPDTRANEVSKTMLDSINSQLSEIISEAFYQNTLFPKHITITYLPDYHMVRGVTKFLDGSTPKVSIQLRLYDILNLRYYTVKEVWDNLFHESIHAKFRLRSSPEFWQQYSGLAVGLLGRSGHGPLFQDMSLIFETTTRQDWLKSLHFDTSRAYSLYKELQVSYPNDMAEMERQATRYLLTPLDMRRAERASERQHWLRTFLLKYKPTSHEQLRHWATMAKARAMVERKKRYRREETERLRHQQNLASRRRELPEIPQQVDPQASRWEEARRGRRARRQRWRQRLLNPDQQRMLSGLESMNRSQGQRP